MSWMRPGSALKVVEVIGSSVISSSEAAINAVRVTAISPRDIQDVEVLSCSADVAADGGISLYTVGCKIAFAVHRSPAATVGG